MLTIKLPDGSEKNFKKPTNGYEIANSIGFTRQMVSLIVVTIFEKVKNNVKVKINTDSSLIKIKKGFKYYYVKRML